MQRLSIQRVCGKRTKLSTYIVRVSTTNLVDQAWAPQGRIWRSNCKGLNGSGTGKGATVCNGQRVVKIIIVAISYGKGVIQCTQYEKINVEFLASFVENNFDAMCMLAGTRTSWLWIQGGDPSQIKIVSPNELCWNAGVLSYY